MGLLSLLQSVQPLDTLLQTALQYSPSPRLHLCMTETPGKVWGAGLW